MPDEPAPRAGLAGLLGQILGYIDRPWKAAVVILLMVIGGVGWALYEKRAELVEEWLTPSETELKVDEVPADLQKLTEETDAELVQIWAVDLSANSQRFIAARRHDGERPVIPNPRRLPVMDHTSDARRLVDILDGHPVCVDLNPNGTPVARRLYERGMKRACAVPIPPSVNRILGVIYLAWSTPVDASSENVAVAAARDIAKTLVTR